MKKTTLTFAGIVALVALVAAPFLYAGADRAHAMGAMGGHHMGAGMGMGPLGHLQRLQKELGLSDQQVSEIKAIFADLRTQNAADREQLHGGMQGVISTLVRNPDDVAGAQAIIDQQAQVQRTLKTNLLNATSKALKVLTPEQREKLGERIAQRHARHAGQQF